MAFPIQSLMRCPGLKITIPSAIHGIARRLGFPFHRTTSSPSELPHRLPLVFSTCPFFRALLPFQLTRCNLEEQCSRLTNPHLTNWSLEFSILLLHLRFRLATLGSFITSKFLVGAPLLGGLCLVLVSQNASSESGICKYGNGDEICGGAKLEGWYKILVTESVWRKGLATIWVEVCKEKAEESMRGAPPQGAF